MRKLLANRFTVTTTIATGVIYYTQGQVGAGHFCEVIALLLWLWGGRFRFWPRKPEPVSIGNGIVRITARPSGLAGRGGVAVMVTRLDPAWQQWLASPANDPRMVGQGR